MTGDGQKEGKLLLPHVILKVCAWKNTTKNMYGVTKKRDLR